MPRRFTVFNNAGSINIKFGYGSESSLKTDNTSHPSNVALKMHGKNTISDLSFDPTKLLSTNKLGIAPYNTKLKVRYRLNEPGFTAAAANSVTLINETTIEFDNAESLNSESKEGVRSSLECTNEEPIVAGNSDLSNEELKERAKAYYAAQNRAVTKQDYESLIYQMPPKFGSVSRANVINDPSSTNREITIYVVSQNFSGYLTKTHQITKNNIKNYLSHYIPINDSVTIKDPFIINFGIEFVALSDKTYDSDEVLFNCYNELEKYFSTKLYIGEPLYLTKIYEVLNNVDGVYDVKRVKAHSKTGTAYNNTEINMENLLSKDGTYYKIPKNVILELKYPNLDIKGNVK